MFGRRLESLSPSARLLLAVAAAEPTAQHSLICDAARRLGVDPATTESEVAGLADFGATVMFRHPLVRSVAYHSVPVAHRHVIRWTLAELTDADGQPDRVAWHLAMAATGPDEALATQLAQAATRAMDRGGYTAAGTFLARAAELSVDDQLHGDRLLAASEAALTAGRLDQARALLDQAEAGASSDRQLAVALRLGGEVSFARGQTDDAARLLLSAAKQLMPVDARLGRRTLLAALTAAEYTGDDATAEVRAFAKNIFDTRVDLEDRSCVADCLLLWLSAPPLRCTEKGGPPCSRRRWAISGTPRRPTQSACRSRSPSVGWQAPSCWTRTPYSRCWTPTCSSLVEQAHSGFSLRPWRHWPLL